MATSSIKVEGSCALLAKVKGILVAWRSSTQYITSARSVVETMVSLSIDTIMGQGRLLSYRNMAARGQHDAEASCALLRQIDDVA